jgi:hypothetical protein
VSLICDKEILKLKAHLKNKFKISTSSNFFVKSLRIPEIDQSSGGLKIDIFQPYFKQFS